MYILQTKNVCQKMYDMYMGSGHLRSVCPRKDMREAPGAHLRLVLSAHGAGFVFAEMAAASCFLILVIAEREMKGLIMNAPCKLAANNS